MSKIAGIIFDLDGVLIDATDWHYDALNRALGLFGFTISRYEHLAHYNGLPTRTKLDMLSVEKGLPRALHALIAQAKQVYTREEILTKCRPSFEMEYMLSRLRREGYRLAVCSNAIRESVELMLRQARARDYFEFVMGNEDAQAPKPDPEAYLTAMRRLGVRPEETVAVEDSDYGVEAATRAGARVCRVANAREVDYYRVRDAIRAAEARGDEAVLTIVVPIGGDAKRFAERGYTFPKPLVEIAGRPMVEIVVGNVTPREPHRFVFVCRREHLTRFALADVLALVAPGCAVVPMEAPTAGALCTVLLALEHIPGAGELLLVNGDQYVEASIDDFLGAARAAGVDGSIMTFPSTHPKWSYARVEDGEVVAVAEKRPISRDATVGIYYFRRGGDFVAAAERMILKEARAVGEFYICPVYNEMILAGRRISVYPITRERMHSLGTPEDVETFAASKARDLP